MAYDYLFKKLIRCHCKANYRGQLQRKVPVYVCTNYSNNGNCTRRSVKEEMLVYYITKYCNEKGIQFERNHYFLADILDSILVDEQGAVIISYKDGVEQNVGDRRGEAQ